MIYLYVFIHFIHVPYFLVETPIPNKRLTPFNHLASWLKQRDKRPVSNKCLGVVNMPCGFSCYNYGSI